MAKPFGMRISVAETISTFIQSNPRSPNHTLTQGHPCFRKMSHALCNLADVRPIMHNWTRHSTLHQFHTHFQTSINMGGSCTHLWGVGGPLQRQWDREVVGAVAAAPWLRARSLPRPTDFSYVVPAVERVRPWRAPWRRVVTPQGRRPLGRRRRAPAGAIYRDGVVAVGGYEGCESAAGTVHGRGYVCAAAGDAVLCILVFV